MFFLRDALSSTVALTDGVGAVSTSYTYEPFGAGTADASDMNPFQYTARERDGTALYYYRARYYHPSLQRFMSEDPIAFRGGDPNLYAYVLNNPVRLNDPLGLDVTVAIYQCCRSYNHIGIAVNSNQTVGFRPTISSLPLWFGEVSDDLALYPEGPITSLTLKTTADQDEKIRRFIDRVRDRPGIYTVLGGRHCGTFVRDALAAGGINLASDSSNPNWIIAELLERAQQQGALLAP